MKAYVLAQPLFKQTKPTYLNRQQNTDLCYFKGTSSLPHYNTLKFELEFVNTLCTQRDQTIPILIEKTKIGIFTIIFCRGIIGYALCDLALRRNTRKLNMRDCSVYTYSSLNKFEELDNCFMLSKIVN